MLEIGINCKAQPLERLKSRFVEFQKRMSLKQHQEPESPVIQSRPVLSTVSTAPNINPIEISKPPILSQNSNRVQVFVDPVSEENPADRLLPSAASSNAWSDYGTRENNRKENVRQATQWAGMKLGQPLIPPKPKVKIPVFRDEVSLIIKYHLHKFKRKRNKSLRRSKD